MPLKLSGASAELIDPWGALFEREAQALADFRETLLGVFNQDAGKVAAFMDVMLAPMSNAMTPPPTLTEKRQQLSDAIRLGEEYLAVLGAAEWWNMGLTFTLRLPMGKGSRLNAILAIQEALYQQKEAWEAVDSSTRQTSRRYVLARSVGRAMADVGEKVKETWEGTAWRLIEACMVAAKLMEDAETVDMRALIRRARKGADDYIDEK